MEHVEMKIDLYTCTKYQWNMVIEMHTDMYII